MGRISSGRSFASSLALASLALVACVAAPASGTAGTPEGHPTYGGVPVACSDNTSYAMGNFYSGNQGYEFSFGASGGIITRWQYLAASGGGTVALQVLSEQTGNGVFALLAESAVEAPTPSTLNEFTTHIPLGPGFYSLGIKAVSGSPECVSTGFPYDEVVQKSPAPAVGSGSTQYGNPQADARINAAMTAEADEDQDGFGDSTEEGCPGNTQRHDDCIKPGLPDLTSKPRKRKIKFTFSSDEPGTFECHLKNKPFSPCASPLKLRKLKPGRYVFTVRAVDANNNKGPQTSFAWNVKRPRNGHH